jgi:protein ImuB
MCETRDVQPSALYACLYQPPAPSAQDGNRGAVSAVHPLLAIAQEFSPRFERHRDDLVSIDVSGLARLLGPARTIGEELRRAASARGVRAHVAVAGTRMAALLLARARPGLTVIAPGEEAEALAPLPIGILEKLDDDRLDDDRTQSSQSTQSDLDKKNSAVFAVSAFKRWGLKTLGDLASLPSADLASRMGRPALAWQAMARGADVRPLVPMLEEERFESSLDLEWPIEGLEPLSFVLTRLLEPLSTRLERRDRGAAVLHVLLRLVTRPSTSSGRGEPVEPRDTCARRLELPSPMRDVRTLRTLALVDLESHPPAAAVDRVTVVIDPTPGRVLQHTLFRRAHPTPEQLSTLVARLGALMGPDRFGAPATVDSYRPGVFAMTPFATDHDDQRRTRGTRREISLEESAVSADQRRTRGTRGEISLEESAVSACSALNVVFSAIRRCRRPVPARVAVVDGRPVRVTTDRRGLAGGAVTTCAGPWRTSGEWWMTNTTRKSQVSTLNAQHPPSGETSAFKLEISGWDRDEWDVALSDGAIYRVFRDRDANSWFIDAIVD